MEIVPLILQRMRDEFRTKLVDNVPQDDVSRVTIVKIGLLQENKLERRIAIGITGGDHEKPDWQDGIFSLDAFPDFYVQVPPREVGGGQAWIRRGVVRIEAFLLNEGLDEEAATIAAYETKRRVVDAIESLDINGLVDDSGERVVSIHCPSTTFFQSGGRPESFIFRGKAFWYAVTYKY